MNKPNCCMRAEAVGGDCPHGEDPDMFGPHESEPAGVVICGCGRRYDANEFPECPFCCPTEHSSNRLEAGHNARAEAVR